MTKVPHWIDAEERPSSRWLEKRNPHNDEVLSQFAEGNSDDVRAAVASARKAQPGWAALTPIERGRVLREIAAQLRRLAPEIAASAARETGKPPGASGNAMDEVLASIQQAEFFAGEGSRLFGRTLTSGVPGKQSWTLRQPLGVAGLLVPSNAPVAGIAWKVFPALICGNAVVVKASEHAPEIALLLARAASDAGLPPGVWNVIQGSSAAGAELVRNPEVSLVSFTGSTAVGREIAQVTGARLCRASLELGGKNALVVCDDAELNRAADWAILSAFSNAGQRCASASRLLVFDSIYERFRELLISRTQSLKLGVSEGCDLGPVITRKSQETILRAIQSTEGAKILTGGKAPESPELKRGYYVEPTLLESVSPSATIEMTELFGPLATLHKVRDLPEALEIANSTPYGLTSAIHTQNVDRALWFTQRVRAGVANVNLGTFGSEPHHPFGGFGASGNGTREPGSEALEVYSELKTLSFLNRADLI